MDLTESYAFPGPPSAVWNLLIDPDVVASCLPGCDHLEQIDEDRYLASLSFKVAAIGGQFGGAIAILDKQPPRSYTLVVEGAGRPGFVKGQARIELVEKDGGTTVLVTGEAEVGGLIASVGQRLLSAASKMMLDRFFACLREKVIVPADTKGPALP
jgi:carbon monoxide dehydrogenase subunit G